MIADEKRLQGAEPDHPIQVWEITIIYHLDYIQYRSKIMKKCMILFNVKFLCRDFFFHNFLLTFN